MQQPLRGAATAWGSRALRAPPSFVAASVGRGWVVVEDAGEQQIPCGNDNKKGKGKNNSKDKGSSWLTTDC